MQVEGEDLDDARQTVKLLYQAERMSNNETLLTFYHRFNLRYDNCVLCGVTDIPDGPGSARDFYSKLDETRFGNFIRDKKNNTKRTLNTKNQTHFVFKSVGTRHPSGTK